MSSGEQERQRRREEEEEEEMREHVEYSAMVHEQVMTVNGGLVTFLSLRSTAAESVMETNGEDILCYWGMIMIYVLLRICEARLTTAVLRRMMGHLSHLVGALAAILLLSIFSPPFAFLLFPLSLWFLWLFLVAFSFFRSFFRPPSSPRPPV